MHEYAFFLGCIAPNRYPGCEAAAIKTSEKLGIKLLELQGASCCPAPGAFGSIDLNIWYAMAARNLLLAEQMKKDIALICNGCYKSIYEVNEKLKHHKELREGVNEVLKGIDMEFKGTIDVWHLAELLYDPKICGLQKIRDSVTVPLEGTRIAVHYGCHLMKPKKERHFGSTEHPYWIEEMVAALGAEPVEYRNKMLCCGAGGGVRGYDLVHAIDITNEKMINLREVKADALTEVCPFCQLQFDRGQIEIEEKFGVKWGLPVLHYNELLGLAQGMSPQELALDLHAVSCEPFLEKIL
ncbi:MAG TPA: CoB--CoM heterodisulfide reductase subunit B [Methanoregulaceae archaeon]|nr:MAG: CoB--CoM heterodisulfide reductase subunit B [Methanolinea sp.]HON81081.1 CoB--CoM heterodisulfide reductase subunit B [Methanoregulaceae archaeon]HPD10281.1 CoB--CoM heterodisulfide reductase subunit B [Methanoregulaceae archaeon]HRT14668.1 CoB--CoM heterodisulfide reductase subunit B [Methanoregulaceae archaeon]HRU30238.1 CoB--CoM heterodisulfide reductase subunit B [Methanoregulaceae archaeon]